ncbi:hypothetical protein [Streptosporangium saharense]|uniref:hypothetical protein n=1 Tax=Streptosporangium saharense TaxID=1706840 RepID=UPI003421CBBD
MLIAGSPGSGKTTLARKLAARLSLTHNELDALYHGPGWMKRPTFEKEVEIFSAEPGWVTEDQYHSFIGELLWKRADTLVWLDFKHRTVMLRVTRRSLIRALMRRELWNGNRERFRDWLKLSHPVRSSLSEYATKRRLTADRIIRHPHLDVVRLSSARNARIWLASVRLRGWEK